LKKSRDIFVFLFSGAQNFPPPPEWERPDEPEKERVPPLDLPELLLSEDFLTFEVRL